MTTRVKRRKYGRTADATHSLGATHIIKIGYDRRSDKDKHPVPGKLPGFLICRDSLGSDNQPIIDFDAMLRIDPGCSADKIGKAKTQQLKSAGLLPTTLHFVLTHDARRTPDGWAYPGTYAEAYECWDKDGLFCQGDGTVAMRKDGQGGRKDRECVPAGSDSDGQPYCEESVAGLCRGHARLVLCLFVDGQNGKPEPVDRPLGWGARFRFDTSSGYNPIRIISELDQAADRCDGHIAGLTGTLTFSIQKKRYGKRKDNAGKEIAAGVATVGQVMFQISEPDIRAREDLIWNRSLAMKQADAVGLLEHKASATEAAALVNENPFDPDAADFTCTDSEEDGGEIDFPDADVPAENVPPSRVEIVEEAAPQPVTADQQRALAELCQKTGTDPAKVADWAGVNFFAEMSFEKADEALNFLAKRLARQMEGTA